MNRSAARLDVVQRSPGIRPRQGCAGYYELSLELLGVLMVIKRTVGDRALCLREEIFRRSREKGLFR